MSKLTTAVAVAVLIVAVPVFSAVVWQDVSAGTAFVGKGDVQLALGYNNKQIQDAAKHLLFSFTDETTYGLTCVKEWETGKRRELHTIVKNRMRTRTMSATVAYDTRQRNQVNGFWLTGFTSVVTSGEMPSCPGGFAAFDIATDWDIDNDGFTVSCAMDANGAPALPCTYTDANGESGAVTGPHAIYPTPTLTGAAGGILTVQHGAYGVPGLVWPQPVQ
jgi:hypothetical protein